MPRGKSKVRRFFAAVRLSLCIFAHFNPLQSVCIQEGGRHQSKKMRPGGTRRSVKVRRDVLRPFLTRRMRYFRAFASRHANAQKHEQLTMRHLRPTPRSVSAGNNVFCRYMAKIEAFFCVETSHGLQNPSHKSRFRWDGCGETSEKSPERPPSATETALKGGQTGVSALTL